MKAHLHNRQYKIHNFDNYPHLTLTSAVLIGAGVVAASAVGTTMYSNAAQDTRQKKILGAAEAKERAMKKKLDESAIQSRQTAEDKAALQRRAQTDTILTSPLGIQTDATTARPTILGAG